MFEQAIDKQTMYRALEEAECLGMKVAIVPDPEFQPGGSREGECDGWSYHPEVVTNEEYGRIEKEGTFTDDAPIRCPKCKTEIADVSVGMFGACREEIHQDGHKP